MGLQIFSVVYIITMATHATPGPAHRIIEVTCPAGKRSSSMHGTVYAVGTRYICTPE